MTLEAFKYERGKLLILDQLLLPMETKYLYICNVNDGWEAIHKMNVRGAPAIAIAGCLCLAVELTGKTFSSKEELQNTVSDQLQYLITARPTAVNIKQAAEKFKMMADTLATRNDINVDVMKETILLELEKMLVMDVKINKAIGEHGATHIMERNPGGPVQILTHCNTGTLATAGYGTALGVIRSLHSRQQLKHAYCTETRPYNQGARLTAYELVYEKIPATLICDNMVAWLFKSNSVSAIVVGADRVVANGDTANKIGTYQLSILAKFHNIPFYVAAPTTSIDLNLPDGGYIPLEERNQNEITHIHGFQIAAPGINCWNPAFDVTPCELITGGIITEYGVFRSDQLKEKLNQYMNQK